jgi:hypothetical protein
MNKNRSLGKSCRIYPVTRWLLIPLALAITSCGASVNLDGVRELGKQASVAQQSLPALAADIKGSCLRSARFKIDDRDDLSGQLSAITNLVDVAPKKPTGVEGEDILRSLDKLEPDQLNTERVRELLTRLPEDDSKYKARVKKIRECNDAFDDKLPIRLKQTHDVLLNYLVALGKLASDDQVKFDNEVKQLADAAKGAAVPLKIAVKDDQITSGQQILTFLLRMFTEEKRRGVLFDELKKTGPAVVNYTPFLIETLDAYERQLVLERESINTFYVTIIKWQTDYLKAKPFTQASKPLPPSLLLVDRQWGQDKHAVEERLVAARAYRRILQLIQEQAKVFAKDPDAKTITLDNLNGKANQLALDIQPLLVKMQVLNK